MKLFWILIGTMAIVLVMLIANGEHGQIFGMENNQFANVAYMSMWLVLVAAAVVSRPWEWGEAVRNLAIWAVILLALMTAYVFRYDMQDFGSRMTGGIIPGSPISGQTTDGRSTVTLVRGDNGHFYANAKVNGKDITFLVDTGATSTVLSAEDAARIGINTENLAYTIPVSTANGNTMNARSRIAYLNIGGIERDNLPCLISKPGTNDDSLLGMNFIKSLWGFEIRGDRLILTN